MAGVTGDGEAIAGEQAATMSTKPTVRRVTHGPHAGPTYGEGFGLGQGTGVPPGGGNSPAATAWMAVTSGCNEDP